MYVNQPDDDAWIIFARDPEKAEAQAPFRGFLHRYVDDSVQRRIILGPQSSKTNACCIQRIA
ncbi:hypothetical protein F5Y02DRAFT_401957 [Annulohypoxylon stygium]|nr:hypothetical protein F5Y02DRAFT_401957 [Annulohypoxylon stygium]